MRKLIFISLLLFISIFVSAEDWYVSTTGNDGDTGADITHPWKTWHYAFNNTPPSDTCYFRGGVYPAYNTSIGVRLRSSAHDGTRTHPTCFFAYPADWAAGNYPVLDCQIIQNIPGSGEPNQFGIELARCSNFYI